MYRKIKKLLIFLRAKGMQRLQLTILLEVADCFLPVGSCYFNLLQSSYHCIK